MLIRIKHAQHGFHHVYSTTELEEAKKRGWEEDGDRESEDKPNSPPAKRGRPRKQ